MPLSPIERKVALLREGVTMISIARRINVTVAHVSAVVLGKRRSPRVEKAIAEAIHREISDVFPPADGQQVA